MLTVALAYLVAVSAVMLWRGVSVSPAYLLLLLAPLVLLVGRLSPPLGDWAPFVAIVLAYEAMGGVVHHDGLSPQVALLADVETWLFGGHDPSQVLQHAVSGATLRVLAMAATAVYFCHFVVPLAVGLALWVKDRAQYLRFVTALVGMCLTAFILFLVVPTAPPWYAANQHVLSGVADLIRSQHTLPAAVSPLYSQLDPNSTAAFPSLHAAFPTLGWLALRRVYPRGSWILFGWALLVFVSVVFLGEHYVIDVIGGVVLAAATWWVMMRVAVPHVTVLRTALPVLETSAAPARAAHA
jgi:membrane-associated phospholipid phosphatase